MVPYGHDKGVGNGGIGNNAALLVTRVLAVAEFLHLWELFSMRRSINAESSRSKGQRRSSQHHATLQRQKRQGPEADKWRIFGICSDKMVNTTSASEVLLQLVSQLSSVSAKH